MNLTYFKQTKLEANENGMSEAVAFHKSTLKGQCEKKQKERIQLKDLMVQLKELDRHELNKLQTSKSTKITEVNMEAKELYKVSVT